MSVNLPMKVKEALPVYPIDKSVAWTDNLVVLHWIRGRLSEQFMKSLANKIHEGKDITWQ